MMPLSLASAQFLIIFMHLALGYGSRAYNEAEYRHSTMR